MNTHHLRRALAVLAGLAAALLFARARSGQRGPAPATA